MGTRGGRGKVIVRPWLAGGLDKEVALTEAWLQDSPHTRKVFTLAGFVPGSRLTVEQVRRHKEEMRDVILRLGGELVDSDEWDERVTHVIAHVEGRRESMSEKVMAGLAGGRWVLTRRYLDKSHRKGSWLTSPGVFTVSEAVSRHRRAWHNLGLSGSVFYGMRAALLISDLRRAGVYKRIIMSGGGKIYKCFSLQQLITKCPTEQQLTHVFLDPWVLLPSDPRHQDFIRLRDYCLTQGLDIKFMSYKFLFMKIRQFPDLPNDCDYSIFNEKIQEMGMKEFESQKDNLKRPQVSLPHKETGAKKMKSDIVTLDSSDNDEEVEVETVPETSYVSQSEHLVDSSQTDGQDKANSEVNVTDSSSVQSVSAVDVESSDEDDDDDDILVLEQKLALSWQEEGGSPRYLEREKAVAPARNQVRKVEKRPSVYIPSQREEYLRRSEPVQTVTLDSESDGERDIDICHQKKGKSHQFKRTVRNSPARLISESPKRYENAPDLVHIDSDDEVVEVRETELCSNSTPVAGDAAKAGLELGVEAAQIKVLSLKDSVRRIELTAPRQVTVRTQREEFLLAAAAAAEEKTALEFLVKVETESKFDNNSTQANKKNRNVENPPPPPPPPEAENEIKVVSPVVKPIEDCQHEPEDFIEDVIEFEDKFVDVQDNVGPLPVDEFDDSSDFEINTSTEEDKEGDIEQAKDVRLYDGAAFKNLSSSRVNISRLDNRVYLHHKKLMEDYLSSKLEASAPNLDDSFSPTHKILLNRLSPQKQSTSLLYRILSTLYKRFAASRELLDVGFTSHLTPLQYDKHQESPVHTTSDVSFVRQTLQTDFLLLIEDDSENQEPDLFDQDEESDKEEDDVDLNDFDCFKSLNAITFLKRLKLETNSSKFPTSKMVNTIWKTCLLEQPCEQVRLTALDYLHHFLFFLSSKTRDVWLSVALSALRDIKDVKLFKTFDSSNPQEFMLCWEFWKDICGRVVQFSPFSCSEWTEDTENVTDHLGPYQTFTFLVQLMEKDLEIWWKDVGSSNLTSDVKFNYPLVFYILGGTMKDLLKNFSKTVLSLYKQFLKVDHDLTEVRKLVAIFANCLSHLDLSDDYGSLYGGYKRSLANMICSVYTETVLPATRLYCELSLLSPSWLSVLVSHRLMTRASRQFEKVTDVSSLKSKFASLSQSQDVSLLLVIDNFTHKLIGKECRTVPNINVIPSGYQQVHSIFRAYWHYYKNANSDFSTFKQLSRLEDTGNKEKVVKFGNILFHLTSLTQTVALLTEFANSKLSFHSARGRESSEGLDEIGALRALLFAMNSCNEY